jgi:hypothetical protein
LLLRTALLLLIVAFASMCGGVIWSSLQPHQHNMEVGTQQNLKMLATAQHQYIRRTNCYAASAKDLPADPPFIDNELKTAFEIWQKNNDTATPTPKHGYIYRMLQGDQHVGPISYRKDPADSSKGMNTWGIIARTAEPGTAGEHQYFITEAGTIYRHDEPPQGDPQYKQFLLDTVPSDEARQAQGWTVVK